MRVTGTSDVVAVRAHLAANSTGVALPTEYPFTVFKAQLDAEDAEKLVLWWEFQEDTQDRCCRVVRLLGSAASKARVRSFVEGDASKGYGPADLRILQNNEPVIVTASLESDFLYLIDGNNRVMGQQLSCKSFQGVRVFVCVHPQIMKWAYIPMHYKQRRTPRSA
jgi:hypothetical protein